MAGGIDQVEHDSALRGMGKAERDGEAPLDLFLEPVGLHAGQGPNQRRLAMVHMADHRQAQGRCRRALHHFRRKISLAGHGLIYTGTVSAVTTGRP